MWFLLVLLIAVPVIAGCPDGFTPYGKDVCVQDLKPEAAPDDYKVSDEKPPRHPEPAYQRGDVTAAMPKSLMFDDSKLDDEKAQADAQGKAAAGIK